MTINPELWLKPGEARKPQRRPMSANPLQGPGWLQMEEDLPWHEQLTGFDEHPWAQQIWKKTFTRSGKALHFGAKNYVWHVHKHWHLGVCKSSYIVGQKYSGTRSCQRSWVHGPCGAFPTRNLWAAGVWRMSIAGHCRWTFIKHGHGRFMDVVPI